MENCINSISWSAPSNIALVKYWGKRGHQLPCNPSVSLTLEKSRTHTRVSRQKRNQDGATVEFKFEGQARPDFEEKIRRFLQGLPEFGGWHYSIDSRNTFPHSAGIASSASSMAALCLGLTSLQGLTGIELKMRASDLARQASGSACRSLYPHACSWGVESELHGSPVEVHPEFKTLRDSILIVDAGEKSVSSRAGHALMHGHPYAQARFERARAHAQQMLQALKAGDWEQLARITEAEAWDLHAMMMTSTPAFMLMRPETLGIIHKMQSFRKDTGTPVCFTLDAGPNVHLIYPEKAQTAVRSFIEGQLSAFRWIDDGVGLGPRLED